MKIAPWIIGLSLVVTVLLLVIGWHDRHEVGPLPFILGIVWALFTLASLGASRPRPID